MPIAPDLYLTFIVASIAVVVVPGPTVTVVIANSLAHGARAGLLTVAGAQVALAAMLGVLLVGLASIIETMAWWFDWVRLAGALYLVWIGWKLIRSSGRLGDVRPAPRSTRGFLLHGLIVTAANPKALLFFGAFIPQFIDPGGDYVAQTVVLGATFMVTASIGDGSYAVVAGGAGRWLSAARVRMVSRVSGLILIGGGIWLAALRR